LRRDANKSAAAQFRFSIEEKQATALAPEVSAAGFTFAQQQQREQQMGEIFGFGVGVPGALPLRPPQGWVF
jgi:hypothetical protein